MLRVMWPGGSLMWMAARMRWVIAGVGGLVVECRMGRREMGSPVEGEWWVWW